MLLLLLLVAGLQQLHHFITEALLHASNHIVGAVILRCEAIRNLAAIHAGPSVIQSNWAVSLLLVILMILILLNIRVLGLRILIVLLLMVSIFLLLLNIILLLVVLFPRIHIIHIMLRVCDWGYLGHIGDVGSGLGTGPVQDRIREGYCPLWQRLHL